MFLDGEAASTTGTTIKGFVDSIISSVTGTITLTDIATIVAAIIGATLIIYFAWVFGRKGYNSILGVLRGKRAKM